MERNILFLIKTWHKRFKFSEHILITVDGDGRIVYINNLFHRGNFFFDCSKQRPDSLIAPNTRFNIVFGVISADSKVSSLCFSYARVVRAEI